MPVIKRANIIVDCQGVTGTIVGFINETHVGTKGSNFEPSRGGHRITKLETGSISSSGVSGVVDGGTVVSRAGPGVADTEGAVGVGWLVAEDSSS